VEHTEAEGTHARASKPTVSVVITVKNDASGVQLALDSLARQTRLPDEIIVVDGGSSDGTWPSLEGLAQTRRNLRVLRAPGANIAAGRNLGTQAARSGIVATTDSGCCAAADWLEKLIAPFEADPATDFVGGFYHVDSRTLFEEVVGLATMRGQLDPVCEGTFNPSGRSMAYRKDLWRRAGGWPQWLLYSEDTLFDHKMRQLHANWRLAQDAVVHWRPRSTSRALAKQFYLYGTGRGHTQIGAADFAYNLRNLAAVSATALLTIATAWVLPLLVFLVVYFYVWTFHAKAARIAGRTRRLTSYPITLWVMWIVLFSNLAGYLVGSWQRWRSGGQLALAMRAYLATE